MKVKNLFVALSILSITACNSDGGKTKVSGTVEDSEQIFISMLTPQEEKALDTLAVTDSKFNYIITNDSVAGFYAIGTSDRFRFPLFVESGEKVEIEITGKSGDRNYTVSGSEGSERMMKVNNLMRDAMDRIDRLDSINQSSMDSTNFIQVRMKSDSIRKFVAEETSEELKAMIDENPGSMTNLFLLSQSMGRTPLITPMDDMEYYEKVLAALEEKYPNSDHVIFFTERVAKLREAMAMQAEMEKVKENLQPGKEVPNIEMPGPDGTTHSLADLKGKVVLIDFWAGWCRPCRMENPNLVRMYNAYKGKGFDVFSVSLDGLPQQPNPKEDWTKAIEDDGLVWENHVSDLQGWSSSVVRKFGFTGIPFTVLIDREGKIIATELRGPQLEAKLKEVLGS